MRGLNDATHAFGQKVIRTAGNSHIAPLGGECDTYPAFTFRGRAQNPPQTDQPLMMLAGILMLAPLECAMNRAQFAGKNRPQIGDGAVRPDEKSNVVEVFDSAIDRDIGVQAEEVD